MEAIKELPEHLKSEIRLLLEGKGGGALAQTVGIQALDLGYISSDHLKAIADSARDLFICPARMDNMPLALIESIASSTPMVSFRVGGVSELVRTGITDYLAEPENIEDFRDGTIKLL